MHTDDIAKQPCNPDDIGVSSEISTKYVCLHTAHRLDECSTIYRTSVKSNTRMYT